MKGVNQMANKNIKKEEKKKKKSDISSAVAPALKSVVTQPELIKKPAKKQ